jgi:methionyl aminopeptidase
VHGVPQKKAFKSGDVVKLDLTLGYKGMIVDSAITLIVAEASNADAKRLVEGTKKALQAGIAAIRGDGTRVGDISSAVFQVLTQYKLGVIRDLVGHGVGYDIHEQPNIPNYGVAGTGPVLSAGMTLAIEPMATLGDWHVNIQKDGTVLVADGSIGAHFEHTVLIKEDSAEILTTTQS